MKRLCLRCSRPARFRNPKGQWKTDKDHQLCPQCWRAMLAAYIATKLPASPRTRLTTAEILADLRQLEAA